MEAGLAILWVLLPLVVNGSAQGAAEGEGPSGLEEDSDFVSFALLVEHESGRRCSASLVSLRTGLTLAECAGAAAGEGGGGELWARAGLGLRRAPPFGDYERRVVRLALPLPTAEKLADGVALFELESPFGAAALARPVVMATADGECAAAECRVGRVQSPAFVAIEQLRRVGAGQCARARRSRALCLRGASLCAGDAGAGVVCGGKLCAVLSAPASACASTHAALDISQRRAFLRCAHAIHACGRGDCAGVCEETLPLLEAPPAATVDAATLSRMPPVSSPNATTESAAGAVGGPATEVPKSSRAFSETSLAAPPSRSTSLTPPARGPASPPPPAPPRRTTPLPLPPAPVDHPARTATAHVSRPAREYEPGRADFKAGEYGDNAADYADEEGSAKAGGGETHPTSPLRAPPVESLASPRTPLREPPSPRTSQPTSSSAQQRFRSEWHALASISMLLVHTIKLP